LFVLVCKEDIAATIISNLQFKSVCRANCYITSACRWKFEPNMKTE